MLQCHRVPSLLLETMQTNDVIFALLRIGNGKINLLKDSRHKVPFFLEAFLLYNNLGGIYINEICLHIIHS